MKTGTCPKCDGKAIHRVDGNRFGPDITLGGMSKAFLNAYVCVACGYVELYVEDPADLPKIAARWPRAEG